MPRTTLVGCFVCGFWKTGYYNHRLLRPKSGGPEVGVLTDL